MPDPLYDAIARAIGQPLDDDLFERCAAELLREFYPTLRPVEGGNDAGMDGLGDLPNGEPFFLVSTVSEDARRNLDRNVQSHLDAGGDRRVVVFATTRKVTGRRRLELSQHLQEQFGVRLADVHDRADFIHLLYRSPQWRRDLLGVAGQARALTRLPATRRPTPEVPVIGRDGDLEHLRNIAGDLVLVGKPGIGKTFVLQKLMEGDWGLFDDGWEVAKLEDAIRELQPRRVVLDDAHLNEDRIAVLRQLRRVMGAAFDIVAVSWPRQHGQVASVLPASSRYEVRELDRGQILEVIKEVGITGPRELQAHLVDQALGRAGLAVTLAHACISGYVREVATGDALLTDVVGWFRRSLGHEARYVLGVLALAGNSGATMTQVARALGLDRPRVSDLVRGLASGGTVDEASWGGSASRLRVQPASLRYALVRDVFFGGPGSLDAAETISQFDRPSDAVLPMIGAIHRGAPVDWCLLRSLVDPSDQEAVTSYACLGPGETDEMLQFAPQHRAAIAREAYDHDPRSGRALRVLMEFAVGDLREEHSNPNHPLRIVGDRLQRPDGSLEVRRLAVSVADQWLEQGGDQEVGLRVLMHAVHPGTSHSYTDPGLGNTVTMAEAALPVGMINDLSRVWDLILDIVEREWPATLAPVLDGLHSWVYPDVLAFGRGPDEATRVAIRDVATRVISRLVQIAHDKPGVLHRLREYASNAKLAVTVEVPREFDALFPADWDGRDEDGGHEGWARRADDAVRRLADEFEQLPEAEIAARITAADAEAANARITYPRLTPRLAQLLASRLDRPEVLLDALEQRGAARDVLLPVLDRVAVLHPTGWEATVEHLLIDETYSWVATQVTLTRPVGVRLKDAAIGRMTAAHATMIDMLVARGEIDPDTIVRLLDSPNRIVARATAVAIAIRSGGSSLSSLPEAAQRRWRDVIVHTPADDHQYSVILGRDPELFADWLQAWFARIQQDSVHQVAPPTTVVMRLEWLRVATSGAGRVF
jgi:hypothetical protein